MGEKSNKRELILAAAQDIFFEKGYHSTTSEEIAKRAGVGKGTIYQYFESKLEIFVEIHNEFGRRYIQGLQQCIDLEASFAANLHNIAHYHLSNVYHISQNVMRMSSEISPAQMQNAANNLMAEIQKQFDQIMTGLIQQAIDRQEIRPVNEKLLAVYIIGTLVGVVHLGDFHRMNQEELQQLEDEIVDNVLYGVAAMDAEKQ